MEVNEGVEMHKIENLGHCSMETFDFLRRSIRGSLNIYYSNLIPHRVKGKYDIGTRKIVITLDYAEDINHLLLDSIPTNVSNICK